MQDAAELIPALTQDHINYIWALITVGFRLKKSNHLSLILKIYLGANVIVVWSTVEHIVLKAKTCCTHNICVETMSLITVYESATS